MAGIREPAIDYQAAGADTRVNFRWSGGARRSLKRRMRGGLEGGGLLAELPGVEREGDQRNQHLTLGQASMVALRNEPVPEGFGAKHLRAAATDRHIIPHPPPDPVGVLRRAEEAGRQRVLTPEYQQ